MSNHWTLVNCKLQMFYCLPLFCFFCFDPCIPLSLSVAYASLAPLHSLDTPCHHGTIWHCHHLVIKPLLALNMKSWQELMMMILAVAQPRFPTNYPDIRQETYCPVVVLVWPSVSLQTERNVLQTISVTIYRLFRDMLISDFTCKIWRGIEFA